MKHSHSSKYDKIFAMCREFQSVLDCNETSSVDKSPLVAEKKYVILTVLEGNLTFPYQYNNQP